MNKIEFLVNELKNKKNELEEIRDEIVDIESEFCGIETTFDGKYAMVESVDSNQMTAWLYVENENENGESLHISFEHLLEIINKQNV